MPRSADEHRDDAGDPRPRDDTSAAERNGAAAAEPSHVPDRRRPSEYVGPREGHAPVFDRTLRRIMNEIRADGRDAGENALDKAKVDDGPHEDLER